MWCWYRTGLGKVIIEVLSCRAPQRVYKHQATRMESSSCAMLSFLYSISFAAGYWFSMFQTVDYPLKSFSYLFDTREETVLKVMVELGCVKAVEQCGMQFSSNGLSSFVQEHHLRDVCEYSLIKYNGKKLHCIRIGLKCRSSASATTTTNKKSSNKFYSSPKRYERLNKICGEFNNGGVGEMVYWLCLFWMK